MKINFDSVAKSYAASSDFQPPAPPGLDYLPYQKAGIEYALYRRNSLIGDEMGLGKTIQAIGFCNVIRPKRVLILCPASLKLNWVREWNKWTTIGIAATLAPSACWVLNFEQMSKFKRELTISQYDVLIIDEAHFLKNPKALRTRKVFGGRGYTKTVKGLRTKVPGERGIKAERVIALTGTPVENRPMEFFPLLRYLAPETFPDAQQFGIRYAAGRRVFDGWDFTGASNLGELNEKVRSSVMVRRRKRDVLKDLPQKVRQVIEVGGTRSMLEKIMSKVMGPSKNEILTDAEYQAAIKALDESEAKNPAFYDMSKARKELAETKLPFIIAHLENLFSGVDKVICFGHHRELLESLAEHFEGSAVVMGGMTPEEKDSEVYRFQNDPNCRLFLGNFQAAGVGLTLTAASTVVMAETPWKPGEMLQGEDRAHRIGQKFSVLVQHLVLERSWEARIAKTVIRKLEIIEQATDSILGPLL